MLGKFVRVRITNPVGSLNRQYGYRYSLNFGSLEGRRQFDNRTLMGAQLPFYTERESARAYLSLRRKICVLSAIR